MACYMPFLNWPFLPQIPNLTICYFDIKLNKTILEVKIKANSKPIKRLNKI